MTRIGAAVLAGAVGVGGAAWGISQVSRPYANNVAKSTARSQRAEAVLDSLLAAAQTEAADALTEVPGSSDTPELASVVEVADTVTSSVSPILSQKDPGPTPPSPPPTIVPPINPPSPPITAPNIPQTIKDGTPSDVRWSIENLPTCSTESTVPEETLPAQTPATALPSDDVPADSTVDGCDPTAPIEPADDSSTSSDSSSDSSSSDGSSTTLDSRITG